MREPATTSVRRHRPGGRLAAIAAVAAVASLIGASCSEEATPAKDGAGASSTTVAPAGDGSVVSASAGKDWFAGKVPSKATKATGDPIRIGFISTDEGPIGAMPELHGATDAAVAFINDELGGVRGRPIELVPCAVDISPEQSQTCARKMVSEKVPAVLGGIDIASGAAITILKDAGIPWIGGIPLNFDEMTSPLTFQFSGGTPGAFTAFADYAAHTLDAKKVAIAYMDLAQVKTAALDYGKALLEKWGVKVTEVSFSMSTQDYASIIQRAVSDDPDALLIGAADFACPKALQATADLQVKATVMMVGSCVDRKWLDQVGYDKVGKTVFNVENRIDPKARPGADNDVYLAAMAKYGKGTNARGAATVGFRAAMNFWSVVNGIEGDLTSEAIVAAMRKAVDHPSFNGHEFTCDGKLIPALPGLCAPQQVLANVRGPDEFTEVSKGWIDVPKLLAEAGIAQSKP